jgi:hypothetical protein
MGKRNEARRQAALARKRSKQKAATKARNRTASHPQARMAAAVAAAHSPVRECLVPESLFELGIGNIIFSRTLPSGETATAIFLLDVFCLGVKDAFFEILSPGEYEMTISRIKDRAPLRPALPSCARKLIEGAVRYAEVFGLRPHQDYRAAKGIFGDADPTTCSQDFEYGREGKPFYVSGPNDTPAKSRQILAMLERVCGPDGFHFLMASEDGSEI